MQTLAEDIITVILAARSIEDAEREAMLDKFGDENVSDEELKVMLDKLCEAEIALRERENAELEQMRKKNNAEWAAEEARIAPERAKIDEGARLQERVIMKEYMQEVGTLEGELDKVEETIKKNSHESDAMAKIRKGLGI